MKDNVITRWMQAHGCTPLYPIKRVGDRSEAPMETVAQAVTEMELKVFQMACATSAFLQGATMDTLKMGWGTELVDTLFPY